MDIENTENADQVSAEQPFFDEEATLLAKRVVPIENAPAIDLDPGRRGVFGGLSPVLALGIIISAATIGLISGLLISRSKPSTATRQAVQSTSASPDASPAAAENSVNQNVQQATQQTPAPEDKSQKSGDTESKAADNNVSSQVADGPSVADASRRAEIPAPPPPAKTKAEDVKKPAPEKPEEPANPRPARKGDADREPQARNRGRASAQSDDEAFQQDEADREARRQERRQRWARRRDMQDAQADDYPRPAARRIDRIRDIFSGPLP